MSKQIESAFISIDGLADEEAQSTANQRAHSSDNLNEDKDIAVIVPDLKPPTPSDLDTSDKIDELTSLEREIAILHHVEPTPPSTVQKVADPKADGGVLSDDEAKERVMVEMQTVKKKLLASVSGCVDVSCDNISSTDCINGDNGKNNKKKAASRSELKQDDHHFSKSRQINTALDEGILENDDLIAVLKGIDEDSKEKDIKVEGVTIEGEGEYQVIEIEDNETEIVEENPLNITSSSSNNNEKKKGKTHEVLTPQEARQVALQQIETLKGKSRRRKQDIKPIQQPADLITSLVSEWSDDEGGIAEVHQENVKVTKTPTVLLKQHKMEKTSNIPKTANAIKKLAEQKQQTLNDRAKDTTASQSIETPATVNLPPTTGFRRTRVIKRKIIWDPDAPETQFSYANLVRPNASPAVKKEPVTKKGRTTPLSPGKKKDNTSISVTVPTGVKTVTGKLSERPPTPAAKVQPKRLSEAPVANGNKKKKFSEVDRLLGDEGAVNMLNSLEGDRNKKSSDSGDSSKIGVRVRNQTPTPEKVTKKEQPQLKAKRTTKPKASESWDYVYKKQTEDSMIIRRRSNSSYSSTASNRLSLDGPTPTKVKATTVKSPAATRAATKPITKSATENTATTSKVPGKQFEFAKPENKNQNAKKTKIPQAANPLPSDMKKAAPKRIAKSPVTAVDVDDDKPTTSTTAPMLVKDEIDEKKPCPTSSSSDKEIVVTMIGKVAQIMFSTKKAKIPNTFTVHLLNALTTTLDRLGEEKNCNVAVLLSANEHFCQGIDFSDFATGPVEKRHTAASQMAKAVKNFLQTLATFPKPIVAGINGFNSGLGVTMLPLFDVVIGSDKATYETPYVKIGQLPEGYCIWSESSKIRSSFKVKLLWLCEKLHSTESAISGLVNKLTNSNRVNEEALNCANNIASFSLEAYRSMKKSTVESNLENVLTGLEEEHDTLSEQWMSQECLENFKYFIQQGHWKSDAERCEKV